MLTDGTSISVGSFNDGLLRHGKRLPPQGPGYLVPRLWRERDASFTTDEFALALKRVAERVNHEYRGSVLGIADLSRRGGGDSLLHRSHENGRDADLIYYALSADGRPALPTDSMPRYDFRFQARPPRDTPGVVFGPFTPRRFDVPRNWALVRALLQDPNIEIQYLFCHNRLRRALLEHAQQIGEPDELIDRAEALLRQPGDSLPHDDHLHVRVFCAPSDRQFGCRDQGPVRWWKKRYKYMPPVAGLEQEDQAVSRLLASRYFHLPSILH